MSEQRIQYRTPDNIWHLWTQVEIDAYIEQSLTTPPHFEDGPLSIYEETMITLNMLHEHLHQRRPHTLDHETVQDLLSRIDVMAEPLKEMVQALEVQS